MDLAQWLRPSRLASATLMVVLGMIGIFIEAAPLGLSADAYPSPDLLFCVVAYWSTRRPEAAPLILVTALGLVRDLITDAPVGAGMLTLVLASEFLKSVGRGLARRSFTTEFLLMGLVLGAVILAQWMIVILLLAHPPYLIDLGNQWLLTMALYPIFAVILRWLFRIGWRKTAPT